MRFNSAALALLALVVPAFCAPNGLITVEKANGPTSGRFIVTLNQSADKANVLSQLNAFTVTNKWDIINGFAGHCDEATLNFLRAHSDVESITEDGIASIDTVVTQKTATWGLQRISQPEPLGRTDDHSLDFTYTYDDSAGEGVDIYVIDTGIYTQHASFQGRARWGATFGGYADADGNGHGTHCAGTAGSFDYGVAKAASLIAVKVLSDKGAGQYSDILSGIDWVQKQASASGRPSVASMSLGGAGYKPIDDAVAALTNGGVHAIVSAGNNNTDASNVSPARVPSALTVAATNITDTRAYFSNFGAPIKVFAPGVNVTSTWIGSPNDNHVLSGTSMAAPHIAGLVAYLIALDGNVTPADMIIKVQAIAVRDIVKDPGPGTDNNYLAQNIY